ncbi:MAG: hypothetical protein WCK34_15835, partial [Bacteroidota bacterium]
MPLNTIVNRRNEIKLAKAEIEQAFQTAEEQRAETRQLIIRQYTLHRHNREAESDTCRLCL